MAGKIVNRDGVPPPLGVRVRLTTGTRDTQILLNRLDRMIDQVNDELKGDIGPHFTVLALGKLQGLKDARFLIMQHFNGT